jgi:hypothetical protein
VENAAVRQPNIEAAIRRSRDARAQRHSRRRRLLAIAAAVSAMLAGAGFVSLESLTGADVLHAAAVRAESLADLLSQRSPGERTAAQLTKTKRARALAKMHARPRSTTAATEPSELAKILVPPPAEVSLNIAPPVPMASLFMPPMELASSSPGGGSFIVAPPEGGGGVSPPGGGPESFPNEPREPVPSAVPEPSSWALMLLGFFLIGWRGRQARTALQGA